MTALSEFRATIPRAKESEQIAAETLDDLSDDIIAKLDCGVDHGNIIIRRRRKHRNGDRHTAIAWYNANQKVWRRQDVMDQTFPSAAAMIKYRAVELV